MQSGMLLAGLGALLVLGGLLLVAGRTIWSGRLSEPRRPRPVAADATLEPRGRSSVFDLRTHWPGLGLIALGIILLIATAAV